MDKKPLISVLTPVFNQRSYVARTIRSVLNQTYENWEWIILDDGSSDETGDIIKSCKDSRIHYTFQEHAGLEQLTKTYNRALAMSHGDFIAMLDSDDYWPGYKLEMQIKGFDDPDCILSYGECCVVNQEEKQISYMRIPADTGIASNNPTGSALKILMLERYCFIANSTVMLRKRTLLDIGGFIESGGLSQDFTTWTRLSLEGRFFPVPACLGYWRRHPSSTNLSLDPEVWFDKGIRFLREFALRNDARLRDIGFYHGVESLEKRWDEAKKYMSPISTITGRCCC